MFLIIPINAKNTHSILNQINVGRVFTVEDQIIIKLVTKAKTYSHQNCTSKTRPGIIIAALTTKAKNSTVLALFQYSFLSIDFNATIQSVLIFILPHFAGMPGLEPGTLELTALCSAN